MNTRFETTEITGMAIILLGLLLIAAAPARADHLPEGAKCINGVVVAPHQGAPGKEWNWIPQGMTCDAVEFAVHEQDMVRNLGREHPSGIHFQTGKPGYGYSVVN